MFTTNTVLGVKRSDGKWDASVTSSNHNGADKEEMERIRSEHPGEPECILDDRVLGSIAVTRGKYYVPRPSMCAEG